jgi:hypothetical protein
LDAAFNEAPTMGRGNPLSNDPTRAGLAEWGPLTTEPKGKKSPAIAEIRDPGRFGCTGSNFKDTTGGSTYPPVSMNVTEAVKDSGVLVAIGIILHRRAFIGRSLSKNSN